MNRFISFGLSLSLSFMAFASYDNTYPEEENTSSYNSHIESIPPQSNHTDSSYPSNTPHFSQNNSLPYPHYRESSSNHGSSRNRPSRDNNQPPYFSFEESSTKSPNFTLPSHKNQFFSSAYEKPEKSQVLRLEEKLSTALQRSKELENKLQEKRSAYSLVCDENSQLLADYKRSKNDWEKTKNQLEKEKMQKSQEIVELMNTKQTLEYRLSQVQSDLAFSNSQLQKSEGDYRNSQNDLQYTQKELREISAQLNQSELNAATLQKRNDGLQQELDKTNQMIKMGQNSLNKMLQQEKEKRELQINGFFSERDTLKEKNQKLKEKYNQLSQEKEELEKKIALQAQEKEKREEMDRAEDGLQLKEELKKLTQTNRDLEKLMATQKGEYKNKINELQYVQQLNDGTKDDSETKKINQKIQSFIPELMMKLFEKFNLPEDKIDTYVMALMDLKGLKLIEAAEEFLKEATR